MGFPADSDASGTGSLQPLASKTGPHPGGPSAWEQERRATATQCGWKKVHTASSTCQLIKNNKQQQKSINKRKTRCQKNASVDTKLSLVK